MFHNRCGVGDVLSFFILLVAFPLLIGLLYLTLLLRILVFGSSSSLSFSGIDKAGQDYCM